MAKSAGGLETNARSDDAVSPGPFHSAGRASSFSFGCKINPPQADRAIAGDSATLSLSVTESALPATSLRAMERESMPQLAAF
jgi:hypothetical protein